MSAPFATIHLPAGVDQRCRDILDDLCRHGRDCGHLEDEPIGAVCLIHPTLVRCAACAVRHVAGHTTSQEFDCDICGCRLDRFGDDELAVMLAHAVEVDCTVSIGRGRRAAVGQVVLTGWAACPSCEPSVTGVAE